MVYVLTHLTAGNAAGNRSGAKNTGIEVVFWLPAVHTSSSLPGSALRDGCSHVLGLRIVVLKALRRALGRLLWQRHSNPLQTWRRLLCQLLRQRQSLVDISLFHAGFGCPAIHAVIGGSAIQIFFKDVPPSPQGAEPHEFRLLTRTRTKGHTARATTQRAVIQHFKRPLVGRGKAFPPGLVRVLSSSFWLSVCWSFGFRFLSCPWGLLVSFGAPGPSGLTRACERSRQRQAPLQVQLPGPSGLTRAHERSRRRHAQLRVQLPGPSGLTRAHERSRRRHAPFTVCHRAQVH